MMNSALWQHEALQGEQSSNIEEPPTKDTQQFYNLLTEANKSLFEGSSESKLSVCVRLLSISQIGTFLTNAYRNLQNCCWT